MYFGSVRFFKHVILAAIIVAIGSLSFCAVSLSMKNEDLEDEAELLRQSILVLEQNAAEQHTANPPDLVSYEPGGEQEPGGVTAQPDEIYYQQLYPELYCDEPYEVIEREGEKIMYLTFDDGPSELTGSILDKLRENEVKATFFIIGRNIKNGGEILKRIIEEGHTLGIHTYSHQYKDIYASVESFLDDYYAVYQAIYEATGFKASLFRFPGGSVNGYNASNYKEIIAEMLRRGFIYYDWNISAEDTSKASSAKSVRASLLRDYMRFDVGVALLHETGYSLGALDEVITEYKNAGFTFEGLDRTVKQIIFSYPD